MRRVSLLLLFATFALGSCGGGGGKEDVEDLLDRAFSESIRSADLELDAELELNGSASLDRPVRITAKGPFRSNEDKLPSVDLELKVGTDGAGQTVTTGFLSTGDRAFVKFQDVYYEQPEAEVRRANRAIAKNSKRESSLRALGLDPRSWLSEAKEEGEEEVAGVEVRHVSGRLDVEALMRNLNEFVRKSGSALGGATGQAAPDPLSAEDISRIGDVVKDPRFQVYVGKDDDIIRRVSGRIEFEVPEASRAELGGIESGSIQFEVEMANVNGDQEIEAPANARPMSDLTTLLGGGGSLPGLGAQEPAAPDTGAGGAPPDSGAGATPEAEDFREYAECLDEARPEDTDALQRCAELLERP